MSILSPDATEIITSSTFGEMLRIGTIGDGSCFFHALCQAISQEYRNLPLPNRIEHVRNLRKQLAKHISLDIIKLLGRGEIFRLSFITLLGGLEMPLKQIEKIQETLSSDWKDTFVSSCIRIIGDTSLLEPLQKIEQDIQTHFRQHLEYGWVDECLIELIQYLFKRNIQIVSYPSLTKYEGVVNVDMFPETIYILHINDHYETLLTR
jgi:hypothetical protein